MAFQGRPLKGQELQSWRRSDCKGKRTARPSNGKEHFKGRFCFAVELFGLLRLDAELAAVGVDFVAPGLEERL